MFRIRFSVLVFSILLYSFVSGQDRISSRQIFSKTILLEISTGDHGTGFITIYKGNYLLVTAAHVVKGLDTSTQMYYFDTAAINKNTSLPAKSRRLLDFFPSKSIVFQNEHFEGDVYIIRLFPKTKDDSTWLQIVALPFQNINPDLVSISRDIDITVYGYPLYDKALFEPITFKTTLSSGILRLPRADTKKLSYFYLLQDPGMQGFSGGPVFVGAATGGMTFGPDRTWLIGVVHGTFGDVSGGKYAAITPSAYIVDLIKSAYK